MGVVIKDKWAKARKPHKCICCGQTHPKGSEMRSVTQVLDGELRSYYLCGICAELYYILCCDWSDGIRDLGDELSDNDVICAVKCPYHKSALNCGDRPDRNDFDLSADTVTGKFRITCECVTGERHTWEADIIEAAKEASNEKN